MCSTRATILHADLDAFYASVEQRDRPALRGRAMAVGGGVILAASYEARSRGVRTAMNIRAARERCPHLVVVEPRMAAYSEASRRVFEIFDDTTPLVEPISIDEAFLDVSGLQRLVGSPELSRRDQCPGFAALGPADCAMTGARPCQYALGAAGFRPGPIMRPEPRWPLRRLPAARPGELDGNSPSRAINAATTAPLLKRSDASRRVGVEECLLLIGRQIAGAECVL